MADFKLQDVRESKDGERVTFEFLHNDKWKLVMISRSALVQMSGDNVDRLLNIFEKMRDRIAHAAYLHAINNPMLDPILLGSNDF